MENEARHDHTSTPPGEDTPRWLRRLQKGSWEPEVLISGIALAFIFAFPTRSYDFAAYLVQEGGINFIGGWLTALYLAFVINIFKVFFIVHLCFRFAWAALLGVSYAFPEGVRDEGLFDYMRSVTFRKPAEMTLWLERVCSMMFGAPMLLGLALVPITLYLWLLLGVHKFLGVDFFIIYIVFMVSLIGFSLLGVLLRGATRKRFWGHMARSLYISLSSIYSSNLGKWKIFGYMAVIMVLTIPLSCDDTRDFTLFFDVAELPEEKVTWQDEQRSLLARHDPRRRFPRLLVDTEPLPRAIRVLLAHYEADREHVADLNDYSRQFADSVGWHALVHPADVYRLHLDDTLISLAGWHGILMPNSFQQAYETYIPVDHLSAGYHTLSVEKLAVRKFFSRSGTPVVRDQWAVVRFYHPGPLAGIPPTISKTVPSE